MKEDYWTEKENNRYKESETNADKFSGCLILSFIICVIGIIGYVVF